MPSYFVSPFDPVASPYDDPYNRNKRGQRQQPYGAYSPQDELTALEMAKGAAASGMELFSDIMDTFGGRAIRGGPVPDRHTLDVGDHPCFVAAPGARRGIIQLG